jgi:putative membrane protein
MVWILVAVVVVMIATEKGRVPELGETGKLSAVGGMAVAVGILVLSGAFGFLIFDLSLSSPLGLPAPVLFPALAGLFGMPTLLTSLATTPALPHQDLTDPPMTAIDRNASVLSVLTGSGAGVFCALVPGLTTATGTVLAMVARRKASVEQTIVTLSAVNTAAAFTVVLVLFIALRTRSGVTIAVGELLAVEAWDGLAMPGALGYLLIAMVVAACLSFFSTLWLGRLFARHFHRIPYRTLVVFAIVFVCVLVTAFTGLLGIGVLLIGTCIGLLPLFWGVRRSQCMGVLLLPIIAFFL